MKSVESLRNHRQFVEQLMAYRDAIAGEKPSFPPLPLPSRIEEIPALVAHMPPTGKHSKRTPIMTVGLPTGKKDKRKKVISPPVVVSSGDEALDWGSDNGHLYDALDNDIAESAKLEWQHPLQPGSTIYMIMAKLVHKTALLASVSTIYAIDYNLMHRRMGHPSRDVLHQATCHTENFPKEIQSPVGPSNQPICRGCAEGKMHLQLFVDSVS